jgi:hypothetical protein
MYADDAGRLRKSKKKPKPTTEVEEDLIILDEDDKEDDKEKETEKEKKPRCRFHPGTVVAKVRVPRSPYSLSPTDMPALHLLQRLPPAQPARLRRTRRPHPASLRAQRTRRRLDIPPYTTREP